MSAGATTSKAKHRNPPGAVKLGKQSLKHVHGVLCGKIGGHFISGRMVSPGYFLSDAEQAHNYTVLARHAKGRAKKTDLARSKSYARLAKKRRLICARSVARPTGPTSGSFPTQPAPPATPLRFNLSGAIGLALHGGSGAAMRRLSPRAAGASGSNLDVVNGAGQLSDAVTSGSAAISHFLIGPDRKVYVVFNMPVNLANTSQPFFQGGCVLAEIDPSSGVPACIDNTLGMINWPQSGIGSDPSEPIQFDSSGAIYYSGMASGGSTVLRKYLNGVTTNLITDNVMVDHFLVLPTGAVIISGRTTSTSTSWVREIGPGGSLSSLELESANFLSLFPDGNVYMGLSSNSNIGVARYLVGAGQMDSEDWIANSLDPNTTQEHFDTQPLCSGVTPAEENAFCGGSGDEIGWSYQYGGDEYVTAGGGLMGAAAMEYYPTVHFLPSEVTDVTVAEGVANNLVLAGLNSSGQNVLTLYNTSSNTERELIGPGNQIEIYHLNYVAGDNTILFDGLRFSDNQYVIGEYNLSTNQLSFLSTGSVKWSDLQSFG